MHKTLQDIWQFPWIVERTEHELHSVPLYFVDFLWTTNCANCKLCKLVRADLLGCKTAQYVLGLVHCTVCSGWVDLRGHPAQACPRHLAVLCRFIWDFRNVSIFFLSFEDGVEELAGTAEMNDSRLVKVFFLWIDKISKWYFVIWPPFYPLQGLGLDSDLAILAAFCSRFGHDFNLKEF